MTDQQALQTYASSRDAQAFRLLVENYQTLVYSAARRRLASTQDIEDVVQTTFLKLARAAGTLRRNGQGLAAWLYITAINSANELIRADSARRRNESHAARNPAVNPVDTLEVQQLENLVDEAILKLPAPEQFLLIEHFFRSRTQRELAAELRVSQPTIQRRLTAAIDSLRASLTANGQACSSALLASALPTFIHTGVPPHLTASLTKIGLASLPAASVSSPIISSLSTAKLLAGALAAAALLTTGIAITIQAAKSPPPPAPNSSLAAAPAPAPAKTLPAPPADLAPTDLDFTRVSVNFDNLAGPAAAQTFSEQAGSPVRLLQDFSTPPLALHLQKVPYLDALIQFTTLTHGSIVPRNASISYTTIAPPAPTATPLTPNTWTASGPFAAIITGPGGVDYGGLANNRASLGIEFHIEPQNTQYILFPDTLLVDSFLDDLHQPILLDPRFRPSLGGRYYVNSHTLNLSLLLPPNPGTRIALLKGTAPFRLVTQTQTLTTKAPTDQVTQLVGEAGGGAGGGAGASVEFLPVAIKPGGPNQMFREFECQVRFLRNKMNEDSCAALIHFDQARFNFLDTDGQSIPAFPMTMAFPTGDQSAVYTFRTSSNRKRTDPQSVRFEIPTASRRILFPFEFKDFPLPATTRGNR